MISMIYLIWNTPTSPIITSLENLNPYFHLIFYIYYTYMYLSPENSENAIYADLCDLNISHDADSPSNYYGTLLPFLALLSLPPPYIHTPLSLCLGSRKFWNFLKNAKYAVFSVKCFLWVPVAYIIAIWKIPASPIPPITSLPTPLPLLMLFYPHEKRYLCLFKIRKWLLFSILLLYKCIIEQI